MQLCRVTGNLVATQKNEHLVGHKLLIGDDDLISLDLIDAGIGDIVLVAKEGDAVQQILGHKNAPVNTIIIAIVDDIEVAA